MNKEYSFSKRVNEFIDSLKEHPGVIKIITTDNETVILYEDYEHAPIQNFDGTLRTMRMRSAEARQNMSLAKRGHIKTPETKRAQSEALKERHRNGPKYLRLNKKKLIEDAKKKKEDNRPENS